MLYLFIYCSFLFIHFLYHASNIYIPWSFKLLQSLPFWIFYLCNKKFTKGWKKKTLHVICQNNLRIIPETILLKNSEELISRLPIERSYAWSYYQALHVQVIDNICCDTNFGEPIVKLFCFSCQAISIWRLQKFYFLNWHV